MGAPIVAPDLFLAQRRIWFGRMIGVPVEPVELDREPVMEALREVVDAAGGLEFSRDQLRRVVAAAQEEFTGLCEPPYPPAWAGRNTPPVYYCFVDAVSWTRAVKDRFQERLRAALDGDLPLRKRISRQVYSPVQATFEDARLLAQCGLHKFTPPHDNAPARVENGVLFYPVTDRIVDPDDVRANLSFGAGRHVVGVVDTYWDAVRKLTGGLLDIFYPAPAAANQ
jgi:hypothetical protein